MFLNSVVLLLLAGCSAPPEPSPLEPTVVRDADIDPRDHATPRSYDEPLDVAYHPPEGFTSVDTDPLGVWLRARKIGPVFQPLLSWRGDAVLHPGRLVRMGLTGHSQVGLESAVRLRAEYLRESGDPVAFHISGGETLTFAPGADWDAWLAGLFEQVDPDTVRSDSVPAAAPRPGDVLVQETGEHAATIMDVAVKGDEVLVLIGEGYVPAQYFHVEHGPYSYWWPWHPEDGVEGFHEPLPASTLRRWKD